MHPVLAKSLLPLVFLLFIVTVVWLGSLVVLRSALGPDLGATPAPAARSFYSTDLSSRGSLR